MFASRPPGPACTAPCTVPPATLTAGAPPPPPPPPPPGSLGKKKSENADGNAKDGPQPNCVMLRSPTSQAQRRGGFLDDQQATAEQKRRLKQLHWDKLKQAREGTVWSRANRDKLRLDLSQLESLFQVWSMGRGGRRWALVGLFRNVGEHVAVEHLRQGGGQPVPAAGPAVCPLACVHCASARACRPLPAACQPATSFTNMFQTLLIPCPYLRSWRLRPSSGVAPRMTRCG